MAISTEDQTKLHKVNAGLFNAVAGATYLAELETAYETGVTQLAYAELMATNAVFTDTVLGGATDSATIAGILSANFGLPADDVEGSAATQAIAFFTAGLDGGRSAGDLVSEAVDYLSGSPAAEFAEVATLLSNKAAVAAAYSAAKQSSDISVLQAALSTVTGDAALTDAEVDAIVAAADGTPVADPGAGTTFTLTTGASPQDAFALTSANDTVNGATGTLESADAIIDSSSTDADVLNAQVTAAGIQPTIAKVETLNINGDFVTTGLDLTKVSGATALNVNTGITSGTATVIAATTNATAAINAGDNIKTLNVTAAAATGTVGNLAIDAGTATTVGLTAASAADTATLTVNGTVTVTGTTAIETLTLQGAADSTVTIDGVAVAGATMDVAGSSNMTLKASAANITTKTITKSSTGTLTVDINTGGAAADVSKIDADSILLSAALNNTLTVKNGATVGASVDQTALNITGPAATATTNTATLNNTAATQTSVTSTNIKTLTIDSAATAVTGVDATYAAVIAGTNNVTLTGTNDVQVTAGTAAIADASALVGALTYTQATDVATTVKGGSGANTITFANTTVDSTYVGQDGGDNVTTANTTGATSITTGSGSDTITANTATTGTLALNTGGGIDTVSATGLTSGVLSANLGDGDDILTLGTGVTGAVTAVVNGGAGTDTLKIGPASDFSGGTLSLTDLETIQLSATGTITFSAEQMSGMTYNIKGTGTLATDILAVTGVAATTAIDLSTLTMDGTIAAAMQKTTINATASTGAVTVTGSTAHDTITVSANGSTVDGGAGFDVLAGAGGTDIFVYDDGDTMAATNGAAIAAANQAAAVLLTDTISTLTDGTDKLDIKALNGVSASTLVNDQSGAAIAHVATNLGNILVTQGTTAADAIVWVNTAGGATTGYADFEEAIYIVGGAASTWTTADFVLA